MEGSIWLFSESASGRLQRDPNGLYVWRELPALNRLSRRSINTFMCEEISPGSLICWIGTDRGLFRFDPDSPDESAHLPAAQIRSVTAGDFLFYGGAPGVGARSDLPYNRNDLAFEYSVPDFLGIGTPLFQSHLEGDDEAWSEWSLESARTFTNLSEGTYTFRVRARSTLGGLSDEGIFSFRVLPPWHRTWWAYGMYLLGFLGSVLVAANRLAYLHLAALRKSNQELAVKLSAKTEAVEKQRQLLASQNESLVGQNREVEFQRRELAKRNDELQYRQQWSDEQAKLLASQNLEINERRKEILAHQALLENVNQQLQRQSQEAARLAAEADEANQAKSTFLANMSHEIRTPLNAILGFTELLDERTSDSSARRYLEYIQSSGRSLLTLINDILDLSKIEAGKIEIQFSAFDAAQVLREMTHVFSHKVEEKGLEFVVEVDAAFPSQIVLDEHRLRQILINILGNAVKFTEKGHIRLSAKAFPGEAVGSAQTSVRIEIRDTGIGIPEDQIDKIFGAFEQTAGQSTMKFGGTGLGLSITKRLVELMNGSIKVASQLGKGSTFVIDFRDVEYLQEVDPASRKREDSDLASVHFLPARILVVDDIQENRELIKGFLAPYELEITEASGGREAIKKAVLDPPSVILMDLKMPDMGGLEAALELRGHDSLKVTPIIVVSASVIGRDAEEAMKHLDGFVPKPVSRQSLIHELMKYLPQRLVWHTEETKEDEIHLRAGDLTDAEKEKFTELNQRLKNERSRWTHLSERLTINEVEEFGLHIQSLGEEFEFDPVSDWGEKLAESARLFDLETMADTLQSFPDISDQLAVLIA